MITDIFWTNVRFPGRIALVARPRGGEWLEDEVQAWAKVGLDIIVSMLEAEEVDSFSLEQEAELCVANNIEFFNFPVTDRSVPKLNAEFLKFTEKLRKSLTEGKNIGIHCRQSIGRAPVLAAVLMILFGIEPNEAFRQLSVARGIKVPETNEQSSWAEDFFAQTANI